MAEAVQDSKSEQALSRGERSNWAPHIATDVECTEMDVSSASGTMSTYSSSTTSSSSPTSTSFASFSSTSSTASSSYSPSSSSLSAAVDTNIMTLLRLASETLRVGGKLVFFAPHRESDGARGRGRGRDDQLNRGDSIRKFVHVAPHAEQQGDGVRGSTSDFLAVESTSDQQKVIDERVQTKVEALRYDTGGVTDDTSQPSASHGPSLSDHEGLEEQKEESVLPGMGLKMSKRKAFKKRARIAKDEEEESSLLPVATHINKSTKRSMSRTSPTSPLDFLPLLPDSLTLVGYHEQVMSPSFSRWLCVIQKV
jgi:hypothetical protein